MYTYSGVNDAQRRLATQKIRVATPGDMGERSAKIRYSEFAYIPVYALSFSAGAPLQYYKNKIEPKIMHTFQNGARPRIAILAPLLAESALVARAVSEGRAAGGSRA